MGRRGVVQTPSGPMTSAFLTSANMFKQEQIQSSEEVPQMYPDWIQIYSNPVSSPPSSSALHQQAPLGSSKLSESRLWEDEQPQQQPRQHLAPPLTSFLPGSFPPPGSRQPHHSSSCRSFQSYRNFKAPPGPHQAVYSTTTVGGVHTSVDQVVPSHPQPMYWEVTQGQGHPHAQVGPQTSMGYISDLIYNAAIVTNFLEF